MTEKGGQNDKGRDTKKTEPSAIGRPGFAHDLFSIINPKPLLFSPSVLLGLHFPF